MTELYVQFQVADAAYVLPARDVVHIDAFTGATPVPGAPAHVAGLVQSRGRVIPLVALRSRFGLPPRAPDIDTRVLVVQQGARLVGLLVDRAREVLKLAPESFRPPPEAFAHETKSFIEDIAQHGDRIVLRLELSRVIGEQPLAPEAPHAR